MFKEKATTALKGVGFKMTKPRIWIVDFLDGNETHPTAFDIYDEIRRENKGFSFATVYNTLDALVRSGVVKQIKMDVKSFRFDPKVETHGHFLCKKCHKLYDVALGANNISDNIECGQVDELEIKFYGTCTNCLSN
jgi:Fur family peroxide stress response transcriptional regulator